MACGDVRFFRFWLRVRNERKTAAQARRSLWWNHRENRTNERNLLASLPSFIQVRERKRKRKRETDRERANHSEDKEFHSMTVSWLSPSFIWVERRTGRVSDSHSWQTIFTVPLSIRCTFSQWQSGHQMSETLGRLIIIRIFPCCQKVIESEISIRFLWIRNGHFTPWHSLTDNEFALPMCEMRFRFVFVESSATANEPMLMKCTNVLPHDDNKDSDDDNQDSRRKSRRSQARVWTLSRSSEWNADQEWTKWSSA
jgi:hypothetical protein